MPPPSRTYYDDDWLPYWQTVYAPLYDVVYASSGMDVVQINKMCADKFGIEQGDEIPEQMLGPLREWHEDFNENHRRFARYTMYN